MMILLIFELVQVFKMVTGQCFGETKTESKVSGFIKSPGYPGTYYVNEQCNWVVADQFDDYAIILDVQEIQTSYEGLRKRRCSGTLSLNDEKLDCLSSKPFCYIYSTSSKCNTLRSSSDESHCIPKSMDKEGLDIELRTRFFASLTTQRFKMKYFIVDCAEDTTAEVHPFPQTTNADSKSTRNKFLHTNKDGTTQHFNTTTKPDPVPQSTNIETIVIPIILISLIILVLTSFLLWRRRSTSNSKLDHPYVLANNNATNGQSGEESNTYHEWTGSHGLEASTNIYSQIDAMGIQKSENENLENNTRNGIYEDISSAQSAYSLADSNNTIVTDKNNYAFADKGYVDIDGQYSMANDEKSQTDMKNTGYEYADKGYVDIDGKYDMALNDADIPLDSIYEPTCTENNLCGPEIPLRTNPYEKADIGEGSLPQAQYVMAECDTVTSFDNSEKLEHAYEKPENEYQMAFQKNPYEFPESQ